MMGIEVLSADVTALLNEICRRGVPLSQIRQQDFEVTFSISAADLTVIRSIVDRRGDKLKIQRHSFGKSVRYVLARHPVLILGVIGLLVLSMWLPTRILFVQVEGNERIPAKQILEHSGFCGVFFGAIRGEVRNEAVKNYLLDQIPELQWVGVNTKGCVATISVKERPENQKAPIVGNANIVASRDASIKSMTVSRGTAQCQVGQVIRAGELLISGIMTVREGMLRYDYADGEVIAQVIRSVVIEVPLQEEVKVYTGEENIKKSVIFLGKPINFSQKGSIDTSTYDTIIESVRLCLPGGIELPVWIRTERQQAYRMEREYLTDEQAYDIAQSRFRMAVGELLKDAEILSLDSTAVLEDGVCRIVGDAVCLTNIARTVEIPIS